MVFLSVFLPPFPLISPAAIRKQDNYPRCPNTVSPHGAAPTVCQVPWEPWLLTGRSILGRDIGHLSTMWLFRFSCRNWILLPFESHLACTLLKFPMMCCCSSRCFPSENTGKQTCTDHFRTPVHSAGDSSYCLQVFSSAAPHEAQPIGPFTEGHLASALAPWSCLIKGILVS